MKYLLVIIVILFSLTGYSQNFEDRWASLFSYYSIIDVVEGNDKLYAASNNAIFTFDLITNQINTITTVQGLSGDNISTIYYSENFDIIVIGYANGLIELVLEDDTILTVVDIIDKPTIPPNQKRINHFLEFNGNLYIATGFGISVYDLTALEFGDSFFIGDFGAQVGVNQTAVFDGFIYAAMNNKMKRADVNEPNLINFENWSDFYPFGIGGVQHFADNLYAIDFNSRLLRFDGNTPVVINTFPQSNRKIYSTDTFLTVTSQNQSTAFDALMNPVAVVNNLIDYDLSLSSSLAYNNSLYLGTNQDGILAVPFGSNQAQQIVPDGPLFNKVVSIDATPGQLWAVFGEVNFFFNPFPLNERGISQFKNNQWTNIPYEEVLEAKSISKIKINPANPNEVFASAMFGGLLKIEDSIPSVLYNETNSSIEIGFVTPNNPKGDIRVYGSQFDNDGNLWFVQSGSPKGLHRLSSSGQFQGFELTNVIPDPLTETGLNNIDISREGFLFFGSIDNGLVAYNPTTNQALKIGEGIGNGNLPRNDIRTIAIDARNQAWIGSSRGLRVLFNVSGFFEEDANRDTQPIIILDNDGVAQELLFEQSITDIEVDGANNKWIATATSGVFYVSPNGQETLLRFTKENSPLPSDNVLDVAIDSQSGVVYFATVNGLVAYNGTTTAPNESLELLRAYPNPVAPSFNGNVTIDGLTARANVKITDVNGNLVFEEVSQGGSIQWDTSAFGKHKVSSGVYFIMATSNDGLETKIAKVMIIR